MRPLTIGTLAKASGVHLETVRYYERIGLMPKPSRTATNYRNYGPEHVERLSFIRRAREIGFSIGEIKELLVLAEPGRASCAQVQILTTIHLGEVRAKITRSPQAGSHSRRRPGALFCRTRARLSGARYARPPRPS